MSEDLTQVGPVDPTKKTSAIEPEAAQDDDGKMTVCWFNGEEFGPGAVVCSGGARLVCLSNGHWRNTGRC